MKGSVCAQFHQLLGRPMFRSACLLCLFLFLSSTSVFAQEDKLPFEIPKDSKTLPERAIIGTSKGAVEIKFFRLEAPITVRNFEYLARKGFYNNLTFHRYEPGFVIQGGDPKGTGQGGPGYTLPPEHSAKLKHIAGTLGMARLPSEVNPERRSNGSQFYISLKEAPHLDGLYSVFAYITRGIENAQKLRAGDRITNISFSGR